MRSTRTNRRQGPPGVRGFRLLPGLIALSLTALLGCTASEDTDPPRGRALLIGVDGANLRVIEPLMKRGELPHLSRIAAQGVYGNLRSLHPLHSPRIWNSIATGKTPAKHGIYSFVKKDESGGKHLYTAEDRRAHALWNILEQRGRRVAVINWWTTYPPDVVDGIVVSDHFFPEQIDMLRKTFKDESVSRGPLLFPPEWQSRAEEVLHGEEMLTDHPDPFEGNEDLSNR